MWRLTKIEARNLCTFREMEYTPSQGVTTLVFGDNRDNESQRSNGSGKSALIEAIALILTGSPLRKVRAEEIINDGAEVFLTRGADQYGRRRGLIVERTLSRKGPSTVVLTLGGKPVAQPGLTRPTATCWRNWVLPGKKCITISSSRNTSTRTFWGPRTRRKRRSSTAFRAATW